MKTRAKKNENKEKYQSYFKMDLKELYILAFYFQAFDFIIGIKHGFTKSRDTFERGRTLPRHNSVQPQGRRCQAHSPV